MSNPIEDFGKMLDGQMKNLIKGNSGIAVELGTINGNRSLSVSSLGNAIPAGEYMVSLHLQSSPATIRTKLSLQPESEVEAHEHTVELPSKLRGINAGDRVIVAWVGTEPVVVDIVVSS